MIYVILNIVLKKAV